MDDSFWYLIGLVAIISWSIYISVTLPKVRKNRTIYLRDWGLGIARPIKLLFEYKELCERDKESLFWFIYQILLTSFFIIAVIIRSLNHMDLKVEIT
jgi:hypothetical protein